MVGKKPCRLGGRKKPCRLDGRKKPCRLGGRKKPCRLGGRKKPCRLGGRKNITQHIYVLGCVFVHFVLIKRVLGNKVLTVINVSCKTLQVCKLTVWSMHEIFSFKLKKNGYCICTIILFNMC